MDIIKLSDLGKVTKDNKIITNKIRIKSDNINVNNKQYDSRIQ